MTIFTIASKEDFLRAGHDAQVTCEEALVFGRGTRSAKTPGGEVRRQAGAPASLGKFVVR